MVHNASRLCKEGLLQPGGANSRFTERIPSVSFSSQIPMHGAFWRLAWGR